MKQLLSLLFFYVAANPNSFGAEPCGQNNTKAWWGSENTTTRPNRCRLLSSSFCLGRSHQCIYKLQNPGAPDPSNWRREERGHAAWLGCDHTKYKTQERNCRRAKQLPEELSRFEMPMIPRSLTFRLNTHEDHSPKTLRIHVSTVYFRSVPHLGKESKLLELQGYKVISAN